MVMLLVGVVLGIVARGYQTLSRLNLATYQMSQRMELTNFLQRLCYELTSAFTISATDGLITFTRADPTQNLEYNQPAPARLPWPIPLGATAASLDNPSLRVTTEYRLLSDSKEIQRTAFGDSNIVAVNVGEFRASMEPGGRVITVAMKPGEMTAAVQARIVLPLVRP